MTEFEIIYKSFMGFMEESENYAVADNNLIAEYEGVLMADKDNADIITDIWKEYGFCLYKKGLFALLNPKEYNQIARSFPEVSDKAEVFARTATGCLFLWEEYSFGKNIAFLNIHTGQKNIISTSFNVLVEWDLPASGFWLDDCNGKIEFAVMEKFKHIPHDKCAGYSLALALGGKESVSNMELFDFKTHLELVSQLHQ
ncbi:DUF1851 domain-containing protein [Flavobacterium supellecticarium]|uniref:DUF1851 domain-containing protein n=1 Tax=Flavobacterium supellecticarium TaxID=2565924 RepID=A0A4S3ZU22_9FLAO|nr:T6SS immunity protein Tdi1 domain-containing protein [Flavobacterium supellecticarium]THF49204.1 DUF1851 domain-containing protein [Flavobacterium supellecticarium]